MWGKGRAGVVRYVVFVSGQLIDVCGIVNGGIF